MTMIVHSGTPSMCMAMAPPEQREYNPTPSGRKPRWDAPTLVALVWITAMISKFLIEQRFWLFSGYSVIIVATGQPCSCMRSRMQANMADTGL